MAGPAMSTWKRCHLLFDRNSSGAPLRWSSTVSPAIFTKPPSGMAAILYSVPPRVNPSRRGPKPTEKASTRTPTRRAARKWPSSWTKTSTPITKAKESSVVNTAVGPLHWQF